MHLSQANHISYNCDTFLNNTKPELSIKLPIYKNSSLSTNNLLCLLNVLSTTFFFYEIREPFLSMINTVQREGTYK